MSRPSRTDISSAWRRPRTSLVLAVLTCLVVSACGSSDDGAASASDGPVELVVAGQAGTVEKAYVEEILPPFEKESGIKVKWVGGGYSEHLALIEAEGDNPSIDLVLSNPLTTIIGIESNLWAKVDWSKIPNAANLPERFQNEEYTVTIGFQTAGIQYNPVVFKERGWAPPTSWLDLADSKYKNTVKVNEPQIGLTAGWMAMMSHLAGGTEQNMNFDIVKKVLDNTSGPSGSSAQSDQAFAQRNLLIGVANSARSSELVQQGAEVEFVQPTEGVFQFQTPYATLTAGSKKHDAAYKLIDYLLSKPVQDSLPKASGQAPAIVDAKVPADLARFHPSGTTSKVFYPDWNAINKNLPDWVDWWNRQF